jgi:hypothetical protein
MSTIGQYVNKNTVIGDDAMRDAIANNTISTPIGYDNTAVGNNALKNLEPGINENSAFGSQALAALTRGENSAFGAHAGANLDVGSENSYFGNWAGRYNIGSSNTAHGYRALAGDKATNNDPVDDLLPLGYANGIQNTAIGAGAMRYYPRGDMNTATGYNALGFIENGENNTAIGSDAGGSITSGNSNTFIGQGADASGLNAENAQQRTAIGAGAKALNDNTMILGTTETVGIGISAPDPQSRLHVVGTQTGIRAQGSPGIEASGSATNPAIHAIGSATAPAIYAEGTGSVSGPGIAIYAKTSGSRATIHAVASGSGAGAAIHAEASELGIEAAILAEASRSVPAIHAKGYSGTEVIKSQPALYVDGGFQAKIRTLNVAAPGSWQMIGNDYIISITGLLPPIDLSPPRIIDLPSGTAICDGQFFILVNNTAYGGQEPYDIDISIRCPNPGYIQRLDGYRSNTMQLFNKPSYGVTTLLHIANVYYIMSPTQ